MIHNEKTKDLDLYKTGFKSFLTLLKKHYNIFPKNYNFLEKYINLCYTTSRLIYGENHET